MSHPVTAVQTLNGGWHDVQPGTFSMFDGAYGDTLCTWVDPVSDERRIEGLHLVTHVQHSDPATASQPTTALEKVRTDHDVETNDVETNDIEVIETIEVITHT